MTAEKHQSCSKERFFRDTSGHTMRVLQDDGLYRHLVFRSETHSFYWFEIITSPGQLVFSGDGESYVFRRLTDMFEFFRGKNINLDYWAEKLSTGGRDSVWSFQESHFLAALQEQADYLIEGEIVRPDQVERFRQAIKDDITESGFYATADEAYRTVDQFEFWNNEDREFRSQADVRFDDIYEWFDATRDYEWWFVWSCQAIVEGIRQYDEYKEVRVPKWKKLLMKMNIGGTHGLPGSAYLSTCEKCNKRLFYNRKTAKKAANTISPNSGTRAYRCPQGEGWHWGHHNPDNRRVRPND